MEIRKTFSHYDDYNNYNGPITAAGIVFFRVRSDYVSEFFLQRCNIKTYWEDIGGKCCSKDKTPMETAFREMMEETNNGFIISKRNFEKRIIEILYNKRGKYIYYLVNANDITINYKNIGNFEKLQNIGRMFNWIEQDDLENMVKAGKSLLCPRVDYKNVLKIIHKLPINGLKLEQYFYKKNAYFMDCVNMLERSAFQGKAKPLRSNDKKNTKSDTAIVFEVNCPDNKSNCIIDNVIENLIKYATFNIII